jgi:hypothetical protein
MEAHRVDSFSIMEVWGTFEQNRKNFALPESPPPDPCGNEGNIRRKRHEGDTADGNISNLLENSAW